MELSKLHQLLSDFAKNIISNDDLKQLTAYINQSKHNDELHAVMEEIWLGMEHERSFTDVESELLYNRIITSPRFVQASPVKSSTYKKWLRIAAVLVLGVSVAAWLVNNNKSTPDPKISLVKNKPVLPGGNKAYLTLANGKHIILNDVKAGSLAAASVAGIKVSKSDDGMVIYQYTGTVSGESNEVAYNTITTPRGGQYQLILVDGTKVWLNAASSIKFPTVFKGADRPVELSGEAYFEVAKNKLMPFKVKLNGMEVEVLGTHFNISAYADDNRIETTLLEGSVKLNTGKREMLLKPGQQAAFGLNDNTLNIREINTDDAVAWKNGYFVFRNEEIHSVMKKIARWYDVDIDYRELSGKRTFGGSVSRFEKVTDLLHTIELTGAIHFKVEERRITVMP